MDKYQNKYRIPSARHQNWNYGRAGAYFITICTKKKKHYFGKIINGKMQLSQIGVLADVFWYEIKNHAKNIELGAFVVMPNHIHGILILTENNDIAGEESCALGSKNAELRSNPNPSEYAQTRHALSPPQPPGSKNAESDPKSNPSKNAESESNPNPSDNVQTRHALSPPSPLQKSQTRHDALSLPPTPKTHGQKRFRNPGKNTISSIIGGYKSAITRNARRLEYEFAWHPRFHDHIIQNETSFNNIAEYIHNNPQKWQEDKFNK